MHAIEMRNKDVLVLRADGLTSLGGMALMLFGVACLISTLYAPAGWFWGPFFLLVGYLLRFGPHTTVLDRKQNVFKIRRFHFRHQYPLSQIKDVRLVQGRIVVPVHSNSSVDRPYQSYQILLSLEDPNVGRVALLENGNWSLQAQYASEIAHFLGVPFFDESNDSADSTRITHRPSERQRPTSPEEVKKREKQDRWAAKRAERKQQSSGKRK